jgi:hypothetical protein
MKHLMRLYHDGDTRLLFHTIVPMIACVTTAMFAGAEYGSHSITAFGFLKDSPTL